MIKKIATSIKPRNLTAQLEYRGIGNPPSSHPSSAVSNCFPGLEMDFRNVWRRLLVGIQLHEASNLVISVDQNADPQLQILASGWRLISIFDTKTTAPVTGPQEVGGPNMALSFLGDSTTPLEWSNVLALVISRNMGKTVRCRFEKLDDRTQTLEFDLVLKSIFEDAQAVISEDLVPAGGISQSLCSPWMSDYRECYCFYWAASRPDYVNVEEGPDGTSIGNNWMMKGRTANTPKVYHPDDPIDLELMTFMDLYQNWEALLSFVIGGQTQDLHKSPEASKSGTRPTNKRHAGSNTKSESRNRRWGK